MHPQIRRETISLAPAKVIAVFETPTHEAARRRRSEPWAHPHSDTTRRELKDVDSKVSGVGWSLAGCDCWLVFCIDG